MLFAALLDNNNFVVVVVEVVDIIFENAVLRLFVFLCVASVTDHLHVDVEVKAWLQKILAITKEILAMNLEIQVATSGRPDGLAIYDT